LTTETIPISGMPSTAPRFEMKEAANRSGLSLA
jgi:hypothetical protein